MIESDVFSRSSGAQRVEDWSVVGQGKLAGKVFNRPGHRDGGTVITSSVVEIRMLGTGDWARMYPVAFTASGSAYRLGRPSATFGMESAERFIRSRMQADGGAAGAAPRERFDPDATVVKAALDTSFQNFEHIDLYASSFQPL